MTEKVKKNSITTRNLAVARIANRTGCQWPSRTSKVDNFYFIWKGKCHFLSVINGNLGPTPYRFQDMACFPLDSPLPYPLQSFNPQFENVSLPLDN